jgi:hypothetical protein
MRYQCPNGKSINMSLEAFLAMDDDDLKVLNGMNIGGASSNPFESLDEHIEEDIEDPSQHQTLEFLTDEDEPTVEINLDALFNDE